MRAKPGANVTLFDGSGVEFQARVETVGRSEVELAILSRQEVDREPRTRIMLGVALPKGDRQRWLVEKCTELGVAQVTPLDTARSVADAGDKSLERLRRSVVEASKQCGRTRLMEIAAASPWSEFITSRKDGLRLVAHPGGGSIAEIVRQSLAETSQTVHIGIGPEGGLTDDELRLAVEHGWTPVDLGRRILRIETAAVALAALVALQSE
jgi:16S rRNA (uracil1498-N3)-methyltransferase